ncbi:MAG: Ig-like domain-containing protein, partial [Microcoleaceae cyanobacterium]
NSAPGGGGIFNNLNGTANVSDSTISGNSAYLGGGIYNAQGTANVSNSIIAQNTNNNDIDLISGQITSGGNNLIGNVGNVTGVFTNNDITGTAAAPVDAQLLPLADNGGFTTGAPGSATTIQTQALQPTSPAVNAGSTNEPTDQRGITRDSNPDIGAVELENTAPVLDPNPTPILTNIDEDIPDAQNQGSTVADIIVDGSITDSNFNPPDSIPETIAVTAIDNTNGTWEYSITPNTWIAFPNNIADANAVLLDNTASIRFIPNPDYNGTANITFRAWDQFLGQNGDTGIDTTTNGGSTPYSVSSDTANITINPIPDAPTDINLNNDTIKEDQANNTPVGTLSTLDPDIPNDSFTYSLVSGAGDTDNNLFAIDSSNRLVALNPLDFEASATRSVRIQTTDSTGNTFEKEFTINVTDIEEPPVAIDLSNNTLDENQPANAPVGTLSATDPDIGDNLTFSLVNGQGSTNNGLFDIQNNQLIARQPFDFESQDLYEIRVQVDDNQGGTFEKEFTIHINDVNEQPTNLSINPNNINENQSANSIIGTFNTIDPDTGETFNYNFISGQGDTDNALFNIQGDQLVTRQPFDFETQDRYDIRVQTTDSAGNRLALPLHISINDLPEAPTAIALDNDNIPEDQPAGTRVGNLSSTDPDIGDSFTYSLVAGQGDTDNSLFQIVGTELEAAQPFDFEAQANYTVRIQTTDNTGNTFSQAFPINIIDIEESPVGLALNPNNIDENQATNTPVGTLSATDPDTGDTNFTYTLIAGSGDTDNSLFQIQGDQLVANPSFNFEQQDTYSVRVQADDGRGGTFPTSLTVQVNDLNDPPTDIDLSPTSILENQPAGTPVGNLSTTDEDTNDSFTYTLVAGAGDTDNSLFQIQGNQVVTTQPLDFEAQPTYSIRIQTTDSAGATFAEQFTIDATDIEEIPSDITLSPNSIDENQPANSLVGSLAALDPDTNETFTYSLVSGQGDSGNNIFEIQGDRLFARQPLDFETQNSYSIRVEVTDSQGGILDRQIIVNVNDINEAPEFTSSPVTNATTGQQYSYTITTTDPESDPVGITATNLPTWLSLTDNGDGTGTLTGTPTAQDTGNINIEIDATDGQLTTPKQYTINVTDNTGNNQNQPPVATDSTITQDEDNTYTFSTTDFGYTDPDGDPLTTIEIRTLPNVGELLFNGLAVTTSQIINAAQISQLTYRPDPNDNGDNYANFRVRLNDGTSDSNGATVTINVNPVNDPPTAVDNSIRVAADSSQQFQASDFGYSDIDGDPQDSLTITQIPTVGNLTLNGTAVTAGDTIPTNQIDQLEYTPDPNSTGNNLSEIKFTLSDGQADSVEHTININVGPKTTDTAPTAADSNITLNEDNTYQFATPDFNYQDADGDPLNSIIITQIPTVGQLQLNNQPVADGDSISRTDISNLTYIPNHNEFGSNYSNLQFQVNDGQLDSQQTYTLNINVTPVNDDPVFTSGAPTQATVGQPYTYRITTTDPDGDPVNIDSSNIPSWLTFTDNGDGTATLTGTPTNQDIGDTDIQLTVTDPNGGTANKTFTLEVASGANSAPNFTSSPVTNAITGQQYTYTITTTDPDSDTVTINTNNLPTWLSFTDNGDGTATLTGTPTDNDQGSINIELEATDGQLTTTKQYTLKVTDSNQPPVATDSTITLDEDNTYTFSTTDFSYTDNDGDPLTQIEIRTLPDQGSLLFNNQAVTTSQTISAAQIGQLTYRPDPNDNGNNYSTFRVRLNDGTTDSNGATITINVNPVNDPPTAADNTITIATANNSHTFRARDFGYNDIDGDPQDSLTISSLPSNGSLTLNGTAVTANQTIPVDEIDQLVYTPSSNSSGPNVGNFNFTVNDGTDNSIAHTIGFNIGDIPNDNPPTAADQNRTILEDSNYNFSNTDFGYTDNDGDNLDSIIITEIPTAGKLTLNNQEVTPDQTISAGEINQLVYTPNHNENGSNYGNFSFRVNDGQFDSDQEYNFAINVNPVNDDPVFTSGAPTQGTVGQPYTYRITTTDPDGDPLTINQSNLPSWLTFTDNGDGTATLTGTPTNQDIGDTDIQLTVTDPNGGTADKTYQLTVGAGANSAPNFTSSP